MIRCESRLGRTVYECIGRVMIPWGEQEASGITNAHSIDSPLKLPKMSGAPREGLEWGPRECSVLRPQKGNGRGRIEGSGTQEGRCTERHR
eukprot:8471060-Pyramimonas_sp.AAC.1